MVEDRVSRAQEQWRRERPDVDVSPMGVIARLHRLGDLLRAELLALYAAYGLGEGEFDVLATLRRAGDPFELAPGQIAGQTMVTTGAVTKRLDRLEAARLVERRASESDGRGRIARLTSEGRALIDEAFAAHMRNEARLLAGIAADDRAVLERILTDWLGRVDG